MPIKVNTIKMKCERCHIPVSTMVAVPRRRREDGTAICFWQLCLKCAKEVLNAKKVKRGMSKVQQREHDKSGRRTKSSQVRRVRPVVRRIKKGGSENGCKNRVGKINETRPEKNLEIKRIGQQTNFRGNEIKTKRNVSNVAGNFRRKKCPGKSKRDVSVRNRN